MEHEHLLNEIAALIQSSHETQSRINETLKAQNAAIVHIPSKRESVYSVLALLLTILVAVAVSTLVNYVSIKNNQKIGQLNAQTVYIFCQAQPELPECVTPGSDTAKASAILANCRVYANLIAATPPERRIPLTTDKACLALGFQIPTNLEK